MDPLIAAGIIIGALVLVQWLRRPGSALPSEPAASPDLDALFASSSDRPLLIFLHDPWCPISARAAREITQVNAAVRTVDVSRQHELSHEIERRTGIRHASPQAIVIDDGTAVWYASHFSIDRREIERAIASRDATRHRSHVPAD